MKEINLPPFFVGQKVVAIDYVYIFKPGRDVVVKALQQCPKCKRWFIDPGVNEKKEPVMCMCNKHWINKKPTAIAWCDARCFAPIQENFQSISLEKILEEETKLIGVN